MSALFVLAALLARPAGAAESAASLGTGASATVGSGGYSQIALDADGLWRGRSIDPYGWARFSSDNFVRQLALGGGVWKDLRGDWRAAWGGGLIFGGLKDAGAAQGVSVLLETALEKDFERAIAGAGYALTAGSLVGPDESRTVESPAGRRARGAASAASSQVAPERRTDHELSVDAKLLLGAVAPGAGLALVLPSNSRSIVVETLRCKIRVSRALSLIPKVSFEEGAADNAYFSLGLYYLF